ncbi:serine/threonine-protein kinase-like protein CCR4 [Olea europaea var. sylvestris]|uniref:serine/threonine-protein kinase-like protein CCR4 n=1 Tax=Olea europaea var. sylvestris TaxID=158386 RepID=UPI000C1D35A7|nr:serine/threonine-protein kinase-like protein CCR4 [Olea europaea var. sylvestris]
MSQVWMAPCTKHIIDVSERIVSKRIRLLSQHIVSPYTTEAKKRTPVDGNGPQISNVTNHVPGGNFSWIDAGLHHVCAISFHGSLKCWGKMVGEKPRGEFIALASGESRNCALRPNGTAVCWGENGFNLPASLKKMEFIALEAKINVFCGVNRSNYSLLCWGNENFDSNPVFKDVVPGSCTTRNECPCNPLPGYGKYCSEDLVICEPCVKKPIVVVPPPPPLVAPPSRSPSSGGQWNSKMVAFLVVGCVGSFSLFLSLCILSFRYCKITGSRIHDSGRLEEGSLSQQNSQTTQARPSPPVLEKRLSHLISAGNGGHLEEFSLQELLKATNSFSEENKIGTGSFGSVYHGTLDDGREVAVKRAEASSSSSYGGIAKHSQDDKDNAFLNELEFLSRLNHKNLVRLLGYCEDSNELLLVYEYMNNGTLHDHLHKLHTSPFMSWSTRIKVALDAARGVEYLHKYAVPPIIHRDIKSSNILLDTTWTAKVSDFGLSLMGPQDDQSHLSLRAAGTVGYMDPEYYRLQQLTTKSDVYSFGVVLLELLSGHKAIHKNENGVPRNVVDYVVPYIIQDEIHRVLDARVPPPTPFEIEAVAHVGYLAADCVMPEGQDRPSMSEVVNSLDRALEACLAPPVLSRSTTDSST